MTHTDLHQDSDLKAMIYSEILYLENIFSGPTYNQM
jgi:hypothetical protein